MSLTKKEFIATSGNTHTYRIIKQLPEGDLAYLKIGEKIASSVLYDRDYNINKLVKHGYLRFIDEPYEWQKSLVGNNEHSVLCICGVCATNFTPFPLENKCPNCGYEKCVTYYDAQTIDKYMQLKNP